MLSVPQAHEEILNGVVALGSETVALDQLSGRTAGVDHLAKITHPPFAASAMDGYAVKFTDIKKDSKLMIIGESKAGGSFEGVLQNGTAVRIFTGATVPIGADHVIIQEDVVRESNTITVVKHQLRPRNIREAGVDFKKGTLLARAGDKLNDIHGALFAAANLVGGICVKKPNVLIFSNGDELKPPGSTLAPGEIIDSNRYALSALIRSWGGTTEFLGCAPDEGQAIEDMFNRARTADVIIAIGGASVGEYDFMRTGFEAVGGKIIFHKVAVRPGKPTWFGALGRSRVIGLPGNPASAIVASTLFVRPCIQKLAGGTGDVIYQQAVTTNALPENGSRETYLRAKRSFTKDHVLTVTDFHNQDSSLLSTFATCDVLIKREPFAPMSQAGDKVMFVPLVCD